MTDGTLARTDENLDVLAHEARRMARLLEDLSRISMAEGRQLDLRLSQVDPRALIERQVQAAAVAYAEKGVALEPRVEGGSAPVAVDVDRIGEVLGNLLGNALRHTPPGGRVETGAARRGDRVEIWVSDTGEGIAPGDLERVCERFYRVDPARARSSGGSGIGLTIARAIVAAHGGRLWAESAGRGEGARFVISLPLASSR
jgi:signal transduction histidine kinase